MTCPNRLICDLLWPALIWYPWWPGRDSTFREKTHLLSFFTTYLPNWTLKWENCIFSIGLVWEECIYIPDIMGSLLKRGHYSESRWLYIINLILVYVVCGGILRLHIWIGLNLQHPRRIYKAAIAWGIMTIRRRLRFRREDKKLCHQGPVPYAHEVHTFRDHSQKLRRKINRNRKK